MEVAVKKNAGVGGVVMDRKLQRHDSREDRIAYYASLSPEEVDAALAEAGIDPAPTIAAIDKLMREKLEPSTR